ncbi:hypothetical protein DIZ27_38805 [Streptomyces sp. NWU339]|uniref:hypothetical protein n=1 Tax=Streptomyces sp. NWU339 TaxID=2185284 RepID=UPI000D678754|nr:hypothetical protein [Streptomyces sp. NWU339]PWI05485.1 hypothetical protein DIZ27_38805 [Streptomyces sp. NWU339]
MRSNEKMIETRVCLDDAIGPYEAKLDPTNLWNGWLSPHFTLDTVRQLADRTVEMADEYGFDAIPTVHVIDGRADSPSSVHVIEGGTDREGNLRRTVVHVRWPLASEDPERAVSFFTVRPGAEVQTVEPAGEGEPRSVVFTMDWPWWNETDDGGQAGDVYELDDEGRYAVGAWSWCWNYAGWGCPCGLDNHWHVTQCEICGMEREKAVTLMDASSQVGQVLRRLVPEATSALVDLTGLPLIHQVFAGDTEIDMADDTGPFDTETLGAADTILREALDAAAPVDLAAAGWEHVPDEQSDRLYRITFPAARTH